jgi:hypothetical protein
LVLAAASWLGKRPAGRLVGGGLVLVVVMTMTMVVVMVRCGAGDGYGWPRGGESASLVIWPVVVVVVEWAREGRDRWGFVGVVVEVAVVIVLVIVVIAVIAG